ncbi:MAG: hypothetical protein JWN96_719 [Mycobacterium sp.]|nr:hypothetical protein [Mycobacterium sp.]
MWSTEFEELSALWGTRVRVDGPALLTERSALSGAVARGQLSAGGACRLLPCVDGWIAASLPRPSDLELVAPLVQDEVDAPWAAVAKWAARRRKAEIVERARLLGLAVSAVGEATTPLQMPVPGQLQRTPSQPLVVDFSAMWAGPLCARLLRLAGARVVKVESRDRPDGARLGDPRFYELLNAGPESLVVDPQASADRAVLTELVGAADVVIEASRPRALAGWGLSAPEIAGRGTVWLSITAYGRGEGDRIGFGDDVAAGAGLVEWTDGDGPQTPSFVGDAIADPLTGLAGAVAVLRACGRGQVIDLSMAAAAATALAAGP